MQSTTTTLELFFQTWEHNMAAGNVPALVSSFAEVFLYAGPHGTQSVKASDFALALPKKKQLFESLGSQPTTLVSLNETRLDERYTMARTQWLMTFIRNGAEPQRVLADSTYILDTAGDAFKIVFYLAHQDIMAILKERGILPA
jgi:hypothetical protein